MVEVSALEGALAAVGGLSINRDGHGIVTVAGATWATYPQLVSTLDDLTRSQLVYRGQREADWKLESSIDRQLRKLKVPAEKRQAARQRHLSNFKRAVRGRRGSNPPAIQSDDDWWALGQHHDLTTPLLDWTESPYVAAYFAFEDEDGQGQSNMRAVQALSERQVYNRLEELTGDLLTYFKLENSGNQLAFQSLVKEWEEEIDLSVIEGLSRQKFLDQEYFNMLDILFRPKLKEVILKNIEYYKSFIYNISIKCANEEYSERTDEAVKKMGPDSIAPSLENANKAFVHMAVFSTRPSKELLSSAIALCDGPPSQFVRPQSDENPRLINQSGLFTRLPEAASASTLEDQIQLCYPPDYKSLVLLRIPLPNDQRIPILRDLNRMNINRASLFPDLSGAGRYCNFLETVYETSLGTPAPPPA